jgi:hypothetical protein
LTLLQSGTALSDSEIQSLVHTAKAGDKAVEAKSAAADSSSADAGSKPTPHSNEAVRGLRQQLLATFDRENVFDYSALLLRIIRCVESSALVGSRLWVDNRAAALFEVCRSVEPVCFEVDTKSALLFLCLCTEAAPRH